MLIIQIAAAALLVLGSALVFRALLEIDAPTRPPRRIARRHRARSSPNPRSTCPRRPEAPC